MNKIEINVTGMMCKGCENRVYRFNNNKKHH